MLNSVNSMGSQPSFSGNIKIIQKFGDKVIKDAWITDAKQDADLAKILSAIHPIKGNTRTLAEGESNMIRYCLEKLVTGNKLEMDNSAKYIKNIDDKTFLFGNKNTALKLDLKG